MSTKDIKRIEKAAKATFPITDTSIFSGMLQEAFIAGATYEAVRNEKIKTTNL